MDRCKITIITVCFNAASILEETMLSVFNQDYSNLEYLVIDGGSQDNTLEVLDYFARQYCTKPIKFSYISEKDSGIYNAMNKGISKATGEYILFLNAGDVLASPTVISDLVKKALDDADIIYGNHYGRIQECVKLAIPRPLEDIREISVFCHQAVLTRTKILVQDPFDEKYRIVADYDFFLKQFLEGAKFQYVDVNVVYYDLGGVSQQDMTTGKAENIAIRVEHGVLRVDEVQKEWTKIRKMLFLQRIKMAIPYRIRKMRYNERFLPWMYEVEDERRSRL